MLCIALAQLNLFVGDVAGNTQRVIDTAADARDRLKADLVLFPELSLCGYPPEDLLFHNGMRRQVDRGARARARGDERHHGHGRLSRVRRRRRSTTRRRSIRDGEMLANYHKQELPNYKVFDEKRYFKPGKETRIVEHRTASASGC